MRRTVSVGLCHWLLSGLLAVALAACGGGLTPGHGGNGDGGNGNGDGGNGNGDGHDQISDGGSGDSDIQACAAESTKAQQLPLDMYVMLDKSQSMSESVSGGTKWSAVTTALATFLSQSGLDGVSVGLQYFAITNGSTISCTAADYATPAVEIAPLPGVATAIANSITQHSPGSRTPTSAALQGGVDHCKTWAGSHPDHAVILVLATDGDPTECDTNITNIENIARTGATGTPKILTFVIGVGSSLSNLNGIAAAGGSTQAFLVDTGGNVAQQFLDALNTIRGTALGCTYKLPSPDGGVPDFNKVNVQYTPGGGGSPQTFPRVSDQSHCPASGDAWYYDNPSAPTEIVLCDATCAKVTPDTTGEVDVLLGCQTQIID
jgi:hypothetical protein